MQHQVMKRFALCLLGLLLSIFVHPNEAVLHELSICGRENSTATAIADEPPCQDTDRRCRVWAEEDECEKNEDYMLINCPCSCNSCPSITQNEWDDEAQYAMGPLKEEIEYEIQQTEDYMAFYIKYFSSSYEHCRNNHKSCSHWSLLGECQFNPGFMLEECRAACRNCHKVLYDI